MRMVAVRPQIFQTTKLNPPPRATGDYDKVNADADLLALKMKAQYRDLVGKVP